MLHSRTRRVHLVASLTIIAVLTCGCGDIHDPADTSKAPMTITLQSVPPARAAPGARLAYRPRSPQRPHAKVTAADLRLWLNTIKWDRAAAAQSEAAKHQGKSGPGPVVGPSAAASASPCGGTDYPPCYVAQRESGGRYDAYNPTGCGGHSCGGKWQFDPRTWNDYGGYPEAQMAPPAVQDAKAREVWDGGAGCAAWDACG